MVQAEQENGENGGNKMEEEKQYYAVVSVAELERMLEVAKRQSRQSQIICGSGKGVRAKKHSTIVLYAKESPHHEGQLTGFNYRGKGE